jgi:DNA-directed RNA polymerase subunit RPC12/RpoP
MFAVVTCPACQYKFSIPEGDMGKRHVCPNCRSPFIAGKSTAEAVATTAAAPPSTAAGPSYAKTMLGETAPPIKYNCPRCKAPLEAPASEGGTKKPCPACGQRLQVPAAPAPAAAQPNLSKTMLASDESKAAPPIKYNCPNCKKPFESPANEAGTKKNCHACGQRFQIPAASPAANLNKTILASDESKGSPTGVQAGYPPVSAGGAPGTVPAGPTPASSHFTPRNLAIAAGALLLLLIAVPAFIRGGKVDNSDALKKAEEDRLKAQAELEKLKLDIEQRKLDLERQKIADKETRRQLDDLLAQIRAQDAKSRDEAAQRKWDQQKLEYQKLLDDQKARAEKTERDLEDLRKKQQTQQTIIQQPAPPPVIYYPPYHPRYYWPWGGW